MRNILIASVLSFPVSVFAQEVTVGVPVDMDTEISGSLEASYGKAEIMHAAILDKILLDFPLTLYAPPEAEVSYAEIVLTLADGVPDPLTGLNLQLSVPLYPWNEDSTREDTPNDEETPAIQVTKVRVGNKIIISGPNLLAAIQLMQIGDLPSGGFVLRTGFGPGVDIFAREYMGGISGAVLNLTGTGLSIPEPGSATLALAGGLCLVLRRRRHA